MEKERCGKNFKKVMAANRERSPSVFSGRAAIWGAVPLRFILRKMSTTSFGQKQTSLT